MLTARLIIGGLFLLAGLFFLVGNFLTFLALILKSRRTGNENESASFFFFHPTAFSIPALIILPTPTLRIIATTVILLDLLPLATLFVLSKIFPQMHE